MAHLGFSDTRLNIDVIIVTADWLLQQVARENMVRINLSLAHFRLYKQIKHQIRAFLSGFHLIIKKEWLSLFSPNEVQRLISGDAQGQFCKLVTWMSSRDQYLNSLRYKHFFSNTLYFEQKFMVFVNTQLYNPRFAFSYFHAELTMKPVKRAII